MNGVRREHVAIGIKKDSPAVLEVEYGDGRCTISNHDGDGQPMRLRIVWFCRKRGSVVPEYCVRVFCLLLRRSYDGGKERKHCK
ncbi:MAG: hypothetical protein IJ551_03455 [Prevotella sp.]|nr:hypothetical protein [Prevotella sp.]